MRSAAAILLLLAGCGERGAQSEKHGASPEQIARLATPKVEHIDPSASARLQPLQSGDAIGGTPGSGLCDFSRGRQIFLIAAPADSVARLGGRLRHLAHSAPYDDTGGFFEDRQISISVGRAEQAAGGSEAGGRPARLVSTNRRTRVQAELDGIWRCDPLGREPG